MSTERVSENGWGYVQLGRLQQRGLGRDWNHKQ